MHNLWIALVIGGLLTAFLWFNAPLLIQGMASRAWQSLRPALHRGLGQECSQIECLQDICWVTQAAKWAVYQGWPLGSGALHLLIVLWQCRLRADGACGGRGSEASACEVSGVPRCAVPVCRQWSVPGGPGH